MSVPPSSPAPSSTAKPASVKDVEAEARQPIVIQLADTSVLSRLRLWLLYTVLGISLIANLGMYTSWKEYFAGEEGPAEVYYQGEKISADKIAVIEVSGTIMPPYTAHTLQDIKKAKEDSAVKGVLLVVNSPGGFVGDSHQIYHKLKELREQTKKPVYVAMLNMAASGGYYISMGIGPDGKIFAEPTTWTGSIGVIIPHYEVQGLAEKVGVKATPITTGKFKDSLSPFKEISPDDKALWDNIIGQSFEQFLAVIDEGRGNLTLEQIRPLATGEVFTARDAQAKGLIDEIGYEEDALAALKKKLGLEKVRVVKYRHATSYIDLLGSVKANDPREQFNALLEATVPRAMFFCSWGAPFSR